MQSRYYSPKMGRFTSSDTVYDEDAGLQGYDLFVYCGNDPLNRIDISGTDSDKSDAVDLVDDEFKAYGNAAVGHTGSGGGGNGGLWEAFWSTLQSAANGLEMASGVRVGTENHHFLSNKNRTYTPQYRKVTDKYNLKLEDDWNTQRMNDHRGRHTNKYHNFMLSAIGEIDRIADGDSMVFRDGWKILVDYVSSNSWILYAR